MNNKYIKTKQNQKLKVKFFELFQVLYLVNKQAYKLELLKKKKIDDIFYVLLLEHNTIRKGRVDENNTTKLDTGNNNYREYEIKTI